MNDNLPDPQPVVNPYSGSLPKTLGGRLARPVAHPGPVHHVAPQQRAVLKAGDLLRVVVALRAREVMHAAPVVAVEPLGHALHSLAEARHQDRDP